MMTEAELWERLRMLAPQSDTVAVMDEFRRLHSLEEQFEAVRRIVAESSERSSVETVAALRGLLGESNPAERSDG